MDIIYAAEKPSIAGLLSQRCRCDISPDEITVVENPNETGSFYIRWQFSRFVMTPRGEIVRQTLELAD